MNSSRRQLVLALFAGLIAGLLGGYFAAGLTREAAASGPAPIALAPGRELAHETRERAQETLAAPPSAPAPGARQRPAPAPAPANVSPRILDRALAEARVEAGPAKPGAGAIWGRVEDTRARPLAGVVVRAGPVEIAVPGRDPALVGGPAPPLDDLEQAVRDSIQSLAQRRARTLEATTGEDGAFRFDALLEGYWSLAAYRADYVVQADTPSYRIPLDSQVDFRALPILVLPVQVVGVDGQPVETALIECESSDGSQERGSFTWTRQQAQLRLAEGSYRVSAMAQVRGRRGNNGSVLSELVSPQTSLVLREGESPEPLVLTLARRAGIVGRVTFPRDIVKPERGRVFLAPAPESGEVDLDALAQSSQAASIGADGEFAFLDLADGRYAVGVTRGWRGRIAQHTIVEVAGELASVELELPLIDLADYLLVRATSAEGLPLSGLGFQLKYEHAGGSQSSGLTSLDTRDGQSLLTIPDNMRDAWEAPDSKGSFQLDVRHSLYGNRLVQLTPGQREVEVNFSIPAQLEVTIAGFVGSGYEGRLSVAVTRVGDGGRFNGRARDNAPTPAGICEIAALEPGSYVLALMLEQKSRSQSWRSQSTIARTRIELRSGANSAQLALPALYSLSVRAAQQEEGSLVHLRPISAPEDEDLSRFDGRQVSTGADGLAVFEELPAGRYQLWGGGKQQELEVPCGEVLLD